MTRRRWVLVVVATLLAAQLYVNSTGKGHGVFLPEQVRYNGTVQHSLLNLTLPPGTLIDFTDPIHGVPTRPLDTSPHRSHNELQRYPVATHQRVAPSHPRTTVINHRTPRHPPLSCPGEDHTVYVASTANPFYLCTHGEQDVVSSEFIRQGYWGDCLSLEKVLTAIRLSLRLQFLEIVEVGGNIGTCTWLMAAFGASVTAFEPVHKNYVLLSHSTMLNTPRYGRRVIPINKGCGSRPHTATVRSEKGNMGNSVAMMNHTEEQMKLLLEGRQAEWEEHKIEITTLDSEISTHVHFMKMDCQGHEIEALLGARRLLAVHGVDVIKAEFFSDFLRSSGHEPRELLDILEEHGYDVLCNGRMVLPEQFEAFQHNRKTDILAVKRGVYV